jgi:hypothetical protein
MVNANRIKILSLYLLGLWGSNPQQRLTVINKFKLLERGVNNRKSILHIGYNRTM